MLTKEELESFAERLASKVDMLFLVALDGSAALPLMPVPSNGVEAAWLYEQVLLYLLCSWYCCC